MFPESFEKAVWRAFEQNPKLLHGFILGDSGYPLRDWLLTPFLNPQTAAERWYNNCFTSTRATVERCIGVIKCRFHCLHTELRYTPARACKILTACLVLPNMAVEFGTPDPDPDEDDNCDFGCDIPPTLLGRAICQRIVQQFFSNL